jgi:hypothetical protein
MLVFSPRPKTGPWVGVTKALTKVFIYLFICLLIYFFYLFICLFIYLYGSVYKKHDRGDSEPYLESAVAEVVRR